MLTARQKRIVSEMRNEENLLRWHGVPLCKYTFRGKTLPFESTSSFVHSSGLFEKRFEGRRLTIYTLTDLGKNIEI